MAANESALESTELSLNSGSIILCPNDSDFSTQRRLGQEFEVSLDNVNKLSHTKKKQGWLERWLCVMRSQAQILSTHIRSQVWLCVHTCNPNAVLGREGILLRLAGCQPNSGLTERPCLKGINQRVC